MICHVVLMTFTNPDDAPEAQRRLHAMVGQVPSLLTLQVGLDIGHGPASAHLFLQTTYADLAGLRAYAEHPAHVDLLTWLAPRLEQRVVVDAELG